MGYDCYMDDAQDPASLDDPGYFRLSIHVGGAFFDAMHELGMMHGDGIPARAMHTGELITPAQLTAALSAYDAEPGAMAVVRAKVEALAIGAPQLQPPGPQLAYVPMGPGDEVAHDVTYLSGVAMEAQRIGVPAMIRQLLDKWAAWVDYLRRGAEHGGVYIR